MRVRGRYTRQEIAAIEREMRANRAAAEARCPAAVAAARMLDAALAGAQGEECRRLHRAWTACQEAIDAGVDITSLEQIGLKEVR